MTSIAIMFLLVAQGVASPPPPLPGPPWHEAVAEEDKAFARECLEEGHLLMERGLFRPALASYEAGLARWDHPGLHFSRARALWALNRPADALHALWDARRFGGEGLSGDISRVGLDIEDTLTKRYVALLVMDGFSAGELTIGGQRHETTRGHWELVIEAETHELVWANGTKLGLLAAGGQRVHVIASKSGAPQVFTRPLTRADLDAHTARLPRPPMAPRPSGPKMPWPSTRGWQDLAPLLEPLPRSDELGAACRSARGPSARRCKEHEVAVAELERRIALAAKDLQLLVRKMRELTAGGLPYHLP